jgi:hypothetical protein
MQVRRVRQRCTPQTLAAPRAIQPLGDARAIYLITQHVANYYELSLAGKLDTAPPLPTFEDYARYERAHRACPRYAQSASYWKTKLSDSRRIRVRSTSWADEEPTSGSGRVKRSYNTKEKVRTQLVSVPLGPERSAALHAFTAREALFSPIVALGTLLFADLARLSSSANC